MCLPKGKKMNKMKMKMKIDEPDMKRTEHFLKNSRYSFYDTKIQRNQSRTPI